MPLTSERLTCTGTLASVRTTAHSKCKWESLSHSRQLGIVSSMHILALNAGKDNLEQKVAGMN